MLPDTTNTLRKSVDGKLFSLLVASVKEYAIYLIDPNGYIMSWNEGAKHIKGYEEDEVIGKHFSMFYRLDDIKANEPRNILNQALKNGIYEVEGWRVRKDGTVFYANIVFTTLYNENGHLTGFAKVTRDITERKKAEDTRSAVNAELELRVQDNTQKIITNERRFRKLIENSHDGIYLLDKNMNIFYRSLSSEHINGWSNTAMAEYDMARLVHPEDAVLLNNTWNNVLAKPGIPHFLVYRTKHKQGHFIWVECTFNNMLHDKDIDAIVCNFRDITERKKAELEILTLNDTLEKKVIARTLQLEAANKELESFSYSVSHDLRTPLRAVNGYATMLKEDFEDKLGAEGNRIIDTIINSAGLMGRLIDDLLAFSWLSRKELTCYQVDMYTLVKTCISELNETVKHTYDITLHQLPPCLADPKMIKQVWMNLIGNAIKYSSKKARPEIEIGFTAGETTTTYFVKDNGAGFDMEYSSKLFGVFQRLHHSNEFEGTGVGLALVKRIIDKHDGRVWAEAEPGKGAVFFFSLPHVQEPFA